MVSCLDKTVSQHTPQIRLSYFILSGGDTLNVAMDTTTGVYATDTFFVGDTLRFAFAGLTLSNNLKGVDIKWDSTALNLTFGPWNDIAGILLPESDTLACHLLFPEGYNYVAFPVTCIAKKESASLLGLTLSSDSEFSPAKLEILCNVADTVQ